MTRSQLEIDVAGQGLGPRSKIERAPFSLETVSIPPRRSYDFAWDGSCAYIAVHDMINRDGELSGDDIPLTRSLDLRRKLTFVPAGLRINGWCKPGERVNTFTALYLDQNWLFDQLEISPQHRNPKPFVHQNDRALFVTMEKLAAIARAPSETPQLLIDTLALLAGAEALKYARNNVRPRSGLSEAQLASAIALIEAHSTEDLTLERIASASGLSAFHFGRAFKRSTGMSPYRYVIETRLEKAKEMIARDGAASISEIATATGFNSVSHFSKVFTDMVGVSPRTYRKKMRG